MYVEKFGQLSLHYCVFLICIEPPFFHNIIKYKKAATTSRTRLDKALLVHLAGTIKNTNIPSSVGGKK